VVNDLQDDLAELVSLIGDTIYRMLWTLTAIGITVIILLTIIAVRLRDILLSGY
jgi:hypothetical protein